METDYLQPHAATRARTRGKRKETAPERAGIVVQVARLAQWLGQAFADPVGERLEQQKLIDAQRLLRHRR